MKVEIYNLTSAGKQEIAAICRLQNGVVVCEGEAKIADNLKIEGIRDYSSAGSRQLFFSDGQLFLNQLQNNLRSAYLNASAPMPE